MDMGSIAAAIGSLKTASDLAKAFIGVRDSTVIQGKVIELQSAILAAQSSALAAQSEQFTLLNKVLQLEEEVAKARAWDAEKQKYELKRIYPGIVAYALKPETGGAEPRHWLCANCFEQGRKSYLHVQNPLYAMHIYRCQLCSSKFEIDSSISPDKPFNGE
jgi:hypothetical protein